MVAVTLEYDNNNAVLNGILDAVAKMPDVKIIKTLIPSEAETAAEKMSPEEFSCLSLSEQAKILNQSINPSEPKMTMVEIRRLTINDIDALIKLLEQLWSNKSIDKNGVKRIIRQGLNSDYQIYICAIDNGKVIGFCSLTIKNNLWTESNLGNIDELVVDSEYRNQGIGKLLIREIEKIAQNHKCKRLELDSAFHRTIAHQFYEKLGFEKRAYLFTKEIY